MAGTTISEKDGHVLAGEDEIGPAENGRDPPPDRDAVHTRKHLANASAGDMLPTRGTSWNYHDFRGSKWCNILNPDNRNYLRNAYSVLLTRARQGMVVFVPTGSASDPTHSPAFYDPTFNYLKELGIPELA